MGIRNIDKIKDAQGDVKRNIETKKGELSQLKENKNELIQRGIETQDSNMSDDLKKLVMEKINQELESNAEKGEDLAQEMNKDVDTLKELKEDVEAMSESTEQERHKLENKKSIFERFSGGKKLEEATEKMNQEKNQLDSLGASLLEDEKELDNVKRGLELL